jgi:asparagine synthase (glutamine-hydrolysing)
MCGICGMIWAERDRPAELWRVKAMADTIAHRGPDDEGFWCDGPAALGHRRLSIVDLAGGHQPMANEDDSVWIAFNGEIYNHRDLRPSLEAAGHRYRTRSDTETIIHLHEQHGLQAPAKLRGMFAYALWDRKTATLTLARDHTGIKPLYYAISADGSIAFGSEIKAVAASGLVRPTIDAAVIEEFFATGHVAGERTLLSGIRKLPAGHTLTWKDGQCRIDQFWSIGSTPDSREDLGLVPSTPAEAAPHFWKRFVDSVQSQLMSDVPLGVFLSGGLDSSLIVAAMREAGLSQIKSFSVGYAEAHASELPWARLVAKRLGTEHHEVIVSGQQFFDDLEQLTWHRDLPLTFSASTPLYHVSRLARQSVTVVLTGEGSDELFAGYGRYPRALVNREWAQRLDRWLPAVARRGIGRMARSAGRGYVGDRLARSFIGRSGSIADSCLEPFADWHGDLRDSLLSRDVPRGAPWGPLNTLLDARLMDASPLEALLQYDQRTYLEELLMKQDTMSMATSLESRVPFLDHLLVEWAATLPASAKLSGRTGKALVREAARAHLPGEVVDGQKRGFLVPLGEWLRTVGRPALDAWVRPGEDAIFEAGALRRVLREHQSGMDHTARVWRVLAFESWRRTALPRLQQLADDVARQERARSVILTPSN